jgi:hypothetical protein
MNAPAGKQRSWQAYTEGWQVGLGVVFVCALGALLVVPRKVEPDQPPPAVIDRAEQRRELELEQQRATRARAGLPLDVRAVGEAFRRFGRVSTDGESTGPLKGQLRRLAQVAIERQGSEKLLELRALQTELFITAITSLGDQPAGELRELGGSFYAAGRERGWFPPEEVAQDAGELGTLFHVYWGEALGLGQHYPYAPTLNEWRVYYRFLLSRPLAEGAERRGDVERKLGYVAALARQDRDYPAHLARGVLLYRGGAFADSAAELTAHLRQHPDGPWALRAQNYLAACGAALSD